MAFILRNLAFCLLSRCLANRVDVFGANGFRVKRSGDGHDKHQGVSHIKSQQSSNTSWFWGPLCSWYGAEGYVKNGTTAPFWGPYWSENCKCTDIQELTGDGRDFCRDNGRQTFDASPNDYKTCQCKEVPLECIYILVTNPKQFGEPVAKGDGDLEGVGIDGEETAITCNWRWGTRSDQGKWIAAVNGAYKQTVRSFCNSEGLKQCDKLDDYEIRMVTSDEPNRSHEGMRSNPDEAGSYTRITKETGAHCQRRWTWYGHTATRYCNNPDNDPKGDWCIVEIHHEEKQGKNWGYCAPAY